MAITKPKKQPIHGWLIIDKPHGIGSTQALAKARWLFNAEKAGHGGTLDPLATGVLPIAFGEATKTVNWAMDGVKTYQFTVQWGAETSTDDLEGDVVATSDSLKLLTLDHVAMQHRIEAVLPRFIGAVQQRPPVYSAIKVDGERSYDLARAGEAVELAAREIQIDSVKIIDSEKLTETTFEVTCGKGTYVRSLAKDIGRALGWLGHVTMLRRTKVGPFSIENAISLEKLEELSHRPPSENSLTRLLRPIETVLDGIPALAVMASEAQRLRQGQRIPIRQIASVREDFPETAEVVLVTHDSVPLGLFSIENGTLKTIRMFNL